MKKIVGAVLLAGLLGTTHTIPVRAAATPVQVAVNGQYVAFPDASPYIDEKTGRTLVPARFVAEELGLLVQWNGQTNQVTLSNKTDKIVLTIGQNSALVDGKSIPFDTPAVITEGRTMIPLRFISEVFDAKIDWIDERNLVVVTTPGHSKVIPPPAPVADNGDERTLQKSTWIWDTPLIRTDQENLLKFARDNKLTAIYLQFDRDIPVVVYRQFIKTARDHQIRVEALAGRPQWAYPSQQVNIEAFIDWVSTYNATVDPSERFAGLHFDIEPYLLPEWKTENRQVIENWMDNIRLIEQKTKGSGLKLTLDVPFWLPMIKVPDSTYSLSAWMLEKADAVVIMDYRNAALGNDGIVANAHAIAREASTLKKQAVIAVETAPSSEGDFTTFYTTSIKAMKEQMAIAKEKLSHYPSFAGFAIHDYKSWTQLDARSKN